MRKHEATDGWHSRGYLPHFDGDEITQFVTFRLADSLPQQLLETWRSELKEEAGAPISIPRCDGESNSIWIKDTDNVISSIPAWLSPCSVHYYFSIANDIDSRPGSGTV